MYVSMKSRTIVPLLTLLCAISVQAQKIKYKDLFAKLNAKDWESSIQYLPGFLEDKKYAPNAHLQMGLWLEDRFLNYDIVDDSSSLYTAGDSAIMFLEKAKTLITDKELKKDEFYQGFFRRDLRTGEFGIKLSDVHLDIEKKAESIDKRLKDIKDLHKGIAEIEQAQQVAMDAYKQLTEQFGVYNSLLIAADETVQEKLSTIEQRGAESVEKAKQIQRIAKRLETDKYAQDATLNEISEYGVDGLTVENIRSSTISIWNYQEWARAAKSEIIGGVALFKTMLKKYADEVRSAKAQIMASKSAEVAPMPQDLSNQFDKYDPESTVKKLLTIEYYEASILKQINEELNPALKDSSLVGSQLAIRKPALEEAQKMKTMVGSIKESDISAEQKKYGDYMNRFPEKYGTASKYVDEMKKWSGDQVTSLQVAVDHWTEQNSWGYDAENEDKKYALFVQPSAETNEMTFGVSVSTPAEIIIHGIDKTNGEGYIKSFGPDRMVQWGLEFEVPAFKMDMFETDALPASKSAESFYVYNPEEEKNNFTAVSYSLSGKLNWATTITISKEPVNFKFDELTQELTILLYEEGELPQDSDELGYVVIDRTGNAR